MTISTNERVAVATLFRFALVVEYVGSRYHGWQRQDETDVPTVQRELERALARIADHPVTVMCAGRTDAGVNGTWQVVHFETTAKRVERAWVLGTNSHLPDDIAVKHAIKVDDRFHARFSATARRYRYLIYSAPVKPALLSKGVTWTHKQLDTDSMHLAAQSLVGEHDFTSLRAAGCQAKSPIRTIHDISVYRSGELIVIDVAANAFLHHMVRNIAGMLMAIGAGDAPIEWVDEVLVAKDRRKAGITAPPYGLYLVDVCYPDEFGLPVSDVGPYFLS